MRNKLIQLIRGDYDNKQTAVIQIITINIAFFAILALTTFIFFLFKQVHTVQNFFKYFYLPSNFSEFLFQPWSMVSFQFFHSLGNPFHIIFNLLWLYWFGKIFNFYFGNHRVWFLYLSGGIFGGVLFMISYNVFPVFEGSQTYLIGASAGITAIIIALATYMPNFEVFTILGPIKLKWIALITLLMDFAMAPNGLNSGGHISHLGGALWGFLYMYFYQKDKDFSLFFLKIFQKGSFKPPLKIVHFEQKESSSSNKNSQKPSQQEIDRILDKIAAQGYDKLTKEEKQTLYNASKD